MFTRLLLASGVAAVLLSPSAAHASGHASITATPSTAAPKAPISVTGSGFTRGERVTIRFAGVRIARVTATGGSFHRSFPIPASALPGTHWLVVARRGHADLRTQVRVRTDWAAPGFDVAATGWNALENLLGGGNVARLASRWATSIGTSAGAPLVEADGVIYAHSELPASTLWAIRASTGTVLWSTPLPASGWDAPPIVHGGAVFVRSNHPLAHARLEAFSAADGHRLWAQDLSGTLVQSAPVFAHGMLYIQSEDPSGVDALDPETGQQVWQADPDPLHQSSISGVSVSRKTVYAPVGQHLYALNALTGAVRWTSPAAPGGAFETAPSIMGNTAYIATHGVLWAIDTGTGAVRWSKITAGMPAATTSAAVYYVGDPWNGGGGCAMYAISPTGALRWHTHLPACAAINTWPRPVVAHGVVYYTSGTGHLYALATSSGKLLVDLPVAATGLTSPMVVNGKVYAVDADGTVHALGLG